MAQSIKNRIFGSDVPLELKRKIEARQKQKEIVDVLQTMGIVFCVIAVLAMAVVMSLFFLLLDQILKLFLELLLKVSI